MKLLGTYPETKTSWASTVWDLGNGWYAEAVDHGPMNGSTVLVVGTSLVKDNNGIPYIPEGHPNSRVTTHRMPYREFEARAESLILMEVL